MSPIKPERGFLDPAGGPSLQDRDGKHQMNQNGADHEDEDVQLVSKMMSNFMSSSRNPQNLNGLLVYQRFLSMDIVICNRVIAVSLTSPWY